MQFNDLIQRAISIRNQYAELEHHQYGREWTPPEIALGFLGDVGDLMKLIQAKQGVRNIHDVDHKLAHELADCLWSIMVLAHSYDVDLENAFLNTMHDLETMLIQQRNNRKE